MPKPGIVYIAPNPAASSITAIFRQPFSLDCSIRIIDQAGMVVKTVSNKYPAGSNREEIDVSGLQKGLYMLQVANANGIIAFGKFIKL